MDKDLLEAIGQMMEEKLGKKLKSITERLDKLQADVDEFKEDVAEVKEDVAEVKEDVAEVKEDVAGLKEDVAGLKEAHEITRDGVNALLEWSDKISEAQRLPLPKI